MYIKNKGWKFNNVHSSNVEIEKDDTCLWGVKESY